jgi:hypothetical protein
MMPPIHVNRAREVIRVTVDPMVTSLYGTIIKAKQMPL